MLSQLGLLLFRHLVLPRTGARRAHQRHARDVPRGFFVKVFGLRLRYRLGMLQVYIAAAAEHIRIAGEAPAGVGTCIVHRPPVHLTDDD